MARNAHQSYRDRIAGAYQAAWVLKLMAWATTAVGVTALVITGAGYLTGHVSGQAAFGTIVGTVLGTILTGGTAYASATNLGIAGARLELAIDTAGGEPEEPIDLAL